MRRNGRGNIDVCYAIAVNYLQLVPDATNTLIVREKYAVLEDALMLYYDPREDRIIVCWFLPSSRLTNYFKSKMTSTLKNELKDALKNSCRHLIKNAGVPYNAYSSMLRDGLVTTQMTDTKLCVKLISADKRSVFASLTMFLDGSSFDLNIGFVFCNPLESADFLKLKGIYDISEASKALAGTIYEMDVKYVIHRLFLEMHEKKDLDLDTATATTLNALCREVLDPSRKRKREIPCNPPKSTHLPITAEDQLWSDGVWAS